MLMKILVTGCAGFVGFSLSKKLMEIGYQVCGLDNLNSYYETSLKTSRLKILEDAGLKFIEKDLNHIEELENNYDIVINLAAQAGVRLSEKEEINYYQSNILGFHHVLQFCLKNKKTKLIFASSSSVYDDNALIPFNEEETECNPKSIYGLTKKFNEDQAKFYFEKGLISAIGLRFFTVYGPYGRPDMAYFKFARKIVNSEKIDLHNHGKMSRDMTYIDDIVNGIIASIKFVTNANKNTYEIFNLGNNQPVLTNDLLKMLEQKLEKNVQINNIITDNESIMTHADLTKSKKLLSYEPKVTLDQGLDLFLEWFKNYERK